MKILVREDMRMQILEYDDVRIRRYENVKI